MKPEANADILYADIMTDNINRLSYTGTCP